MKRRRVWLLAIVFLSTGTAVLVLSQLAIRHPDIKAQYDAIQTGMTEAQVHDLFGVPPGEYGPHGVGRKPGSRFVIPVFPVDEADEASDNLMAETWIIDGWYFQIIFDGNGTVVAKDCLPVNPPGWRDYMRYWFSM